MVQWHIRSGDWVGYWGNIVGAVLGAIVASVLSIWISQTIQKNAGIEKFKYEYKMKILFSDSTFLMTSLNEIDQQAKILNNLFKNEQNLVNRMSNDTNEKFKRDYSELELLFNYNNEESIPCSLKNIKDETNKIVNNPHYRVYSSMIGQSFGDNLRELQKKLEKYDELENNFNKFKEKVSNTMSKNRQGNSQPTDDGNLYIDCAAQLFSSYQMDPLPELVTEGLKLALIRALGVE